LSGTSSVYVEEMYRVWKENPARCVASHPLRVCPHGGREGVTASPSLRPACSVHVSWDVYFRNVDAGLPPGAAFTPPPSIQSLFTPVAATATGGAASAASAGDIERGVRERLALTHLIRAFQVRGHEVATLDPLLMRNRPAESIPELQVRGMGEGGGVRGSVTAL
jgi:2-oxoglutarate dehydrogenase E1 component